MSGISGLARTAQTTRLLAVCCVCGHIRDELRSSSDPGRWTTQSRYRKTYGRNPAEGPLTHTYCPECFVQAQDAARKYFRELRVYACTPMCSEAASQTDRSH